VRRIRRQLSLALALALAALAVPAALAGAASADPTVSWMPGYHAPGTPKRFDKVGVNKIGPPAAKNVLVLSPGTSAGAAYFVPLARTLVRELPGWQVWSVERRENLLEDQRVANRFKHGHIDSQRFFNYYLGWLADSGVQHHVTPVVDADVGFARGWGMHVEIADLHRVVRAAEGLGGDVVLGGHSLGGTITTAYATWDFHGSAGARGLSGLVFIDGASRPAPITRSAAQQELADLQSSSPWLAFGGIAAPYAGLFAEVGGGLAAADPGSPSLLQNFPLLPANLKPPVPATNQAAFGYASDVATSPANLTAFQVHDGHLAATGNPRTWARAGALTPVGRYARMLFGATVHGADGSAWYHPLRLTIDAGAVANGNRNPAQKVLDVRAIHGDDVHLPMYAFAAALGGHRVIAATRALATQSGVPKRDLTLIDRHATYAHNDPNAADPNNAFLAHLVPFLRSVAPRP